VAGTQVTKVRRVTLGQQALLDLRVVRAMLVAPETQETMVVRVMVVVQEVRVTLAQLEILAV
tara:strand:+ start:1031 stop:1216 length:186 start_codon:yes stop_codon:yes gene_type:complete